MNDTGVKNLILGYYSQCKIEKKQFDSVVILA
ncbi:hypothetical protein PPEP_a6005 [Pseudoalteromonas peptidolytica F12-50-A1]|uniref:Uncharacterized protein n=1 Tax=Pseudoalteromonas peptidolytica F12-50-A1 TaxID=1315280 RepID=A0A8I0T3N5_9GAMM|nr:hypothetical protein [Pseudoalteromonas peptidolytica F12-50-A1]